MRKGLSQEQLKMIACVTMFIDHIGALIVSELYRQTRIPALLEIYDLMRLIGRVSFPIYCFLLAEGATYTGNPKKYALRLAIGAILAEIPYDLAFYGQLTWNKQSVMVTLLLGLCALMLMEKRDHVLWKIVVALPFLLAARYLRTDYGSNGVLLIVLFGLSRELPYRQLCQTLGIWFVFSPGHKMMLNWFRGIKPTLQEWAILAMILIFLYNGEKRSQSKSLQWTFYLFYPVHLLVLYGISLLLG